jgi:hypothetical protein
VVSRFRPGSGNVRSEAQNLSIAESSGVWRSEIRVAEGVSESEPSLLLLGVEAPGRAALPALARPCTAQRKAGAVGHCRRDQERLIGRDAIATDGWHKTLLKPASCSGAEQAFSTASPHG